MCWLFAALLCLLPLAANAQGAAELRGQFPYRQQSVDAGGTAGLFLHLERAAGAAQTVTVRVELPQALRFDGKPGWTREGNVLRREVALEEGYGSWFDLLPFAVFGDAAGAQQLRVEVDGAAQTFSFLVGEQRAAAPELLSVSFPLDATGRCDERRAANTVALQTRATMLRRLLGGENDADFSAQWLQPRAYIGVTLRNTDGLQSAALLKATLLDQTTRQPLAGLYAPNGDGTLERTADHSATQLLQLSGAPEQTVLLPLFLDGDALAAGTYTLRWELTSGGARSALEAPLHLQRDAALSGGAFAAAALACAVGTALFLRKRTRILQNWKAVDYVTVAMFGVVSLLTVNLPSSLLWGISHALLGPFGSLATGLFSAAMLSALTALLLALTSRPGAATLFTVVRIALSALVFGRVSPVSIIAAGASCLFLESALFACGFYATPRDSALMTRRLWLLALLCALAKAVAAFATLQGTMVLYRLYYADWYVWMTVAINGFAYAFFGALAGLHLEAPLRKVRPD